MSEPRILVTPNITCQCIKWHRPKIRIIDRHHIVPLSWDGPDIAGNIVTICPNTHRLVHELLDLYKKYGGFVPSMHLSKFPKYTRNLAAEGWQKSRGLRPNDHAEW